MAEKIPVLKRDLKVVIPKTIFDRKEWVKYLVVNNLHKQVIDKTVFEAVTSTKFNDFLRIHVNAYVTDNKMPPAEISGAVLNIADDLLSGREPTIRAGDYITLQNYLKSSTKS